MDPQVEQLLDNRYRIVAPLGSGGMAEVYLAHDDVLDRDVALKVMSRRYADDEEVVERFTRAVNKSLDHATRNPDAARATIPTFTQIPPEVAEKIRLPLWPSEIDREQLQDLADLAVKYRVIEEAPALDELIWEGAS